MLSDTRSMAAAEVMKPCWTAMSPATARVTVLPSPRAPVKTWWVGDFHGVLRTRVNAPRTLAKWVSRPTITAGRAPNPGW